MEPGKRRVRRHPHGCIFAFGRVVQLRAQRARRARASATELQADGCRDTRLPDRCGRAGSPGWAVAGTAPRRGRGDARRRGRRTSQLDVRLIESVCERGRPPSPSRGGCSDPAVRVRPEGPTQRPDHRRACQRHRRRCLIVTRCAGICGSRCGNAPTPLAWTLAVVPPGLCGRAGTLHSSRLRGGSGRCRRRTADGVLPTVANLFCMVLLAWSAGSAGTGLGIFGALAAGMAVWGSRHYPGNWPSPGASRAVGVRGFRVVGARPRRPRRVRPGRELRADLDARVDRPAARSDSASRASCTT